MNLSFSIHSQRIKSKTEFWGGFDLSLLICLLWVVWFLFELRIQRCLLPCSPIKRFLSFSESAFLLPHMGSCCGQLVSCNSSRMASAVQELFQASCLWSISGGNWSARQLAVSNQSLGFICQVLFPSSTPHQTPAPPKPQQNQPTKSHQKPHHVPGKA